MNSSQKDNITRSYVHGYSQEEQKRLFDQARFLEAMVFDQVEFLPGERVLEIGSGVGAQSQIALNRYPGVILDCIDSNAEQIETARHFHKENLASQKLTITKMDASSLNFEENRFDAVFICWVLEHIAAPLTILSEARRCLKPNGRIICIEVLNSTLFLYPPSPATTQFWNAFNKKQSESGDPFIGSKLGTLLSQAGFSDIDVTFPVQHIDQRQPLRLASMLDYWRRLMMSGADLLLAQEAVSQETVKEISGEIERIKAAQDGLFFYTPAKAFAKKPA